jgi:hypothetical protein
MSAKAASACCLVLIVLKFSSFKQLHIAADSLVSSEPEVCACTDSVIKKKQASRKKYFM